MSPAQRGDGRSPPERFEWAAIWGISTRSDLDSAQKEASQNKEAASTVASSSKAAYEDLQKEVGATSADLAQTEQDLKDAEQAAGKAEQDAAAAKQDADQAKNETDKAKAQAEEAQAEAEAAKSKSAIVADCAKAYFSAFGALFEGESVKDQAPAVKEELQSISGSCKAALGGT
jgi:chromosome segregation ATPase